MLQMILGAAGSGKTERIREEIRILCEQGRSCFLFVPEQNSFQTEKSLIETLGVRMAQNVTLLSFRRLPEYVYRECGRPKGKTVSEEGKHVLMSLALEQCGEELELFQGYRRTEELIDLLLRFDEELKDAGIGTEIFMETMRKVREPALRSKMGEIGLILETFSALTAQSYLDPKEELVRALDPIAEHGLFRDAVVFVDGFHDFSIQETQVLRQILRQAETVYMTFCTDRLYPEKTQKQAEEKKEDLELTESLFQTTSNTAHRFMRICRQEDVPVAKEIVMDSGRRFVSKELEQMESGLYRLEKQQQETCPDSIRLYAGSSRYDEAMYTAQEIRRLVMEKGMRYRDFAIIARDLTGYRGLLDSALQLYEIPYFWDDPKPVGSEPIMQVVLLALQIFTGRYDTESILAYLKTGMVDGFTVEEISELENYTYFWKITGDRWLRPFADNPEGFTDRVTDAASEQLHALNSLRSNLIKPLEGLKQRLEQAENGKESAEAVYLFLIEAGCDQRVKSIVQRLQEIGRFQEAEEQVRLWEMLMGCLDQMADITGDIHLSRERFTTLLNLIISCQQIAGIPEGVDQVTMGEADRIRPALPKVVFVIGAAQDEFPALMGDAGVFTDRERREMIDGGLELTSTLDYQERHEIFLAYHAMCSASHRLYVSWYQMGLDGNIRYPSSIVQELLDVFPKLRERILVRTALPEENAVLTRETAFLELARTVRQKGVYDQTLRKLLEGDPAYERKLQTIDRIADRAPFSFQDPGQAQRLFSERTALSASRIETYEKCPFQYFCSYGMDVRERRRAEMDALEYGTMVHYLLENMLSQGGYSEIPDMPEDQLRAQIRKLLDRYLEQVLGGREEKTRQFLALFHRVEDTAVILLRFIAEGFRHSSFRPTGFEVALDQKQVQAESRQDGREITITGKIDRVDTCSVDGRDYVRIVDYKTGNKEFQFAEILDGLNLQMLIYLQSLLLENTSLHPAGILYMPAHHPEEKDMSDIKMFGMVRDEEEILLSMDDTYAHLKGNGKYGKYLKYNGRLTEDELQIVLEYVGFVIRDMTEQLSEGNIPDLPIKGKNMDGCRFCPYHSICCHEDETDPVRESSRIKDQTEILREMQHRMGGEA